MLKVLLPNNAHNLDVLRVDAVINRVRTTYAPAVALADIINGGVMQGRFCQLLKTLI